MKDWNDFLPPDDNDDFSNDKEDEKFKKVRKFHRLLFIDDIEKRKTDVVPLDPIEFIDMFGKWNHEDMIILTQVFLDDYMKEIVDIYDKWGLSWMYEMMKFNEGQEEYEICSIIRDIINDRPVTHLKGIIEYLK